MERRDRFSRLFVFGFQDPSVKQILMLSVGGSYCLFVTEINRARSWMRKLAAILIRLLSARALAKQKANSFIAQDLQKYNIPDLFF